MSHIFRLLLAIPLVLGSLPGESPAGNAVADIAGRVITSRELQQAGGASLARLEEQLYAFKRQKLEELIADRLLAREASRRNVSVDQLVETEITSKAGDVSADEVHRVYELNKAQLQKPEAEVRDQVEAYLRSQKVVARRQEFVKSLSSQAKVVTYLVPPAPFRAEVSEGGPILGSAGAPVTIVEFEDLQCPFCKKVKVTLDQVLARYKEQVKLVHRDFPLQSLHPTSWLAHEAARCAGEQGKFWEYRNLVYANGPVSGQEQLNNYAAQLKLSAPEFQACIASGKFKAAIQKDEDEGVRIGVEGTPAFFINGRFLSGAQPENGFAQIIDEELNKRAQR